MIVVAGKGHETYQEYKEKIFSDKNCIFKSIKEKNKNLNKNLESEYIK